MLLKIFILHCDSLHVNYPRAQASNGLPGLQGVPGMYGVDVRDVLYPV